MCPWACKKGAWMAHRWRAPRLLLARCGPPCLLPIAASWGVLTILVYQLLAAAGEPNSHPAPAWPAPDPSGGGSQFQPCADL